MKVYEHLKSGELVSFEICNIGRSRACRVVGTLLPTTTVVPQRGDEFARFELNGRTFVLEEPFGDNSRYLIYQQPPQPSPELEQLRDAFARQRVSWFFSGDKSFRLIVGALVIVLVLIAVGIMFVLH